MDANAIEQALAALRDARVHLFNACQARDRLVYRRPVPTEAIADASELVAQAREGVAQAREAAQALMTEETPNADL